MQLLQVRDFSNAPSQRVYLASEVDAEIAKLKEALREAVKWNWGKHAPPNEAEELVNRFL